MLWIIAVPNSQKFIVFCEDVRYEVGEKISLMGLYGPKITVGAGPVGPDGTPVPTQLQNLVVGALFRFPENSPQAIEATFNVEFIPAKGADHELPSPGPITLVLEKGEDDGAWTSQILGTFPHLTIHHGMQIQASLDCLGESISATLEIQVSPAHLS